MISVFAEFHQTGKIYKDVKKSHNTKGQNFCRASESN